MPVTGGLAIEHRQQLNVHVWEWKTDSGGTHQIVWPAGSHRLLYGVHPAHTDRWTVTALDPDRWPVPGGTFTSAQRQVTAFITAATQAC
jgi:hypothetical protein